MTTTSFVLSPAQPPKDKQPVLACMHALACALAPDCLVPMMSNVPDISAAAPDFAMVDTSAVTVSEDLEKKVKEFAIYCHDKWVYEKVSRKSTKWYLIQSTLSVCLSV